MAAAKKQTTIENRQFGPEVAELRRADAKEGTVAGYASTFGNKDRMGSVVVAGAFTNTLRELRAKGRSLPMLLAHDQGRPVGVWTDMREDGHGLLAHGQLDLNTQGGKEARSLIQSGGLRGLSIGFLKRENGSKWTKGGVLELTDLDLLECSLCPVPANSEAVVIEARSMGGTTDAVANFIQRLKAARAEIRGLSNARTN